MPNAIFISLPVTDVAHSAAFYTAIGLTRDPAFSNEQAAAMKLSDSITIALMSKAFYATLTPKPPIDARTTSGALFALPCDSRAAVDAISAAALAAGGREAHGAQDEGFLYSRGFEDPDGHGFGPFFMDAAAFAAAPTGAPTDG